MMIVIFQEVGYPGIKCLFGSNVLGSLLNLYLIAKQQVGLQVMLLSQHSFKYLTQQMKTYRIIGLNLFLSLAVGFRK